MKEEYVVFPVVVATEILEDWSQYTTLGEDYHHVYVSPKPKKVVLKDGKFYDKKGNEIQVLDVEHSYSTTSRPNHGFEASRWPRSERKALGIDFSVADVEKGYGFPIPVEKFEKSHTAKEALQKFFNKTLPTKAFELSDKKEIADRQLSKIGIEMSLVKQNKNKR